MKNKFLIAIFSVTLILTGFVVASAQTINGTPKWRWISGNYVEPIPVSGNYAVPSSTDYILGGDSIFTLLSTAGTFTSNWTYSGTDAITPSSTVGIIVNASSTFTSLNSNNATTSGQLVVGTTNPTINLSEGDILAGGSIYSYNGYLQLKNAVPAFDFNESGTFSGLYPSSGDLHIYADTGQQVVMDNQLQLGGTLLMNGQGVNGTLYPVAHDSYDLGTAALGWAGLFLGPDECIDFNNNDILCDNAGSNDFVIDPVSTGATWLIGNASTTGSFVIGDKLGTVSPSAGDLFVSGSATTTGHFEADATLYVKDSKVGVGTLVPNVPLTVKSASGANNDGFKVTRFDDIGQYIGIGTYTQGLIEFTGTNKSLVLQNSDTTLGSILFNTGGANTRMNIGQSTLAVTLATTTQSSSGLTVPATYTLTTSNTSRFLQTEIDGDIGYISVDNGDGFSLGQKNAYTDDAQVSTFLTYDSGGRATSTTGRFNIGTPDSTSIGRGILQVTPDTNGTTLDAPYTAYFGGGQDNTNVAFAFGADAGYASQNRSLAFTFNNSLVRPYFSIQSLFTNVLSATTDTSLALMPSGGSVGIATTTAGGTFGEKLTVTGSAGFTGQLNVIGLGRNTTAADTNLLFGDYPGGNFEQLFWDFTGGKETGIFTLTDSLDVGGQLFAGTSGQFNVDANGAVQAHGGMPYDFNIQVQQAIINKFTSAPRPAIIDISGKRPYLEFYDHDEAVCADFPSIRMPAHYTSNMSLNGQISFKMSTTTSGNVMFYWQLMAVTGGDSASIETDSFDSANTFTTTATAGTVNFMKTITNTGSNLDSVAAGDMATPRLCRDANNGSDTADGRVDVSVFDLYID